MLKWLMSNYVSYPAGNKLKTKHSYRLSVSEISLQEVTLAQVEELSAVAYEVWRESYAGIVPREQVEYMLDKFQSPAALMEQIQAGYHYYFLIYNGKISGYAGIRQDPDCLFLSKLYVLADFRERGIASYAVQEIAKMGRPIRLTVNRGNQRAISAYKKIGFIAVKEQQADIGDGFVMDDYIMELS